MPIYPVDISYNAPITELVAEQGSDSVAKKTLTLGVCELVEANIPRLNTGLSSKLDIYPASSVEDYLKRHNLYSGKYRDAHEDIVLSPAHGRIRFGGDSEDQVGGNFVYVPDGDYIGDDKFSYKVGVDGREVLIYYYIHVIDYPKYATAYNYTGFDTYKRECGEHGNGGEAWKISSFPNQNNIPQSFTQITHAVPLYFSDLPATALAHTLGSGVAAQITLDTTAAGHGWFIDYTPYLNEEFLPTANPNEWIAKPG